LPSRSIENAEQALEAARLDDEVLGGHGHAVEEQVGGRDAVEAVQRLVGTEREAGRVPVDHDRADATRAGGVADPDVDQVLLGVPAARAPALHPVDQVAVGGLHRRRGDVGGRRAGVGLGDRHRHRGLAGHDRRQQAGPLLRRAEEVDDARRARVGLEHLEGRRLVGLGELLDDDERVEQVEARAAVLLGQADAEEPELGQAPPLVGADERAVAVPLDGERRVDVTTDPRGEVAQVDLMLFELEGDHRPRQSGIA